MDAWSEQAAVFIDEIRRLDKELTEFKERCKSLEAENKDLKRRLSIHENYNNPDRSTLTAKKRKKHRKKGKEKKAEEAKAAGKDASGILKKRGGQPGSKGVSFPLKPDKNLEDRQIAVMCIVVQIKNRKFGRQISLNQE